MIEWSGNVKIWLFEKEEVHCGGTSIYRQISKGLILMEKYPIDESSVTIKPPPPPLAFSLNLIVLLTSTDDFEYQSAFAALDELKFDDLKPFFKKQFLQVAHMIITRPFVGSPSPDKLPE